MAERTGDASAPDLPDPDGAPTAVSASAAGPAGRGIDWRYVRDTPARWAAVLWFGFYSVWTTYWAVVAGDLGGDGRLYTMAASAWLAGEDPWRTWVDWHGGGAGRIYFGAPPPTLLFFAPFTPLPPEVAGLAWVAIDAVAIVAIVRRLKLPWWWLLFPPGVVATVAGNPEPVMLALLVLFRGRLAALAPLLKPYAAIPLAGERRWRSLLVAAAILVLTAVLLPWGTFLAELDRVRAVLEDQAANLSAWAYPVLIPASVLALASLGLRRAAWLAVPVLWPSSQIHYALVSLPVVAGVPLLAVAFSLPLPGAPAVGVICLAAWLLLRRMAVRRRQAEAAR